ncbi:UNVERIFIED_CONTAM: hypothetical protein ABIC26_002844 [Paenibacillus sp. PvR008]
MKSTVKQANNSLTRKKLANPFSDTPMINRLKKNESIDLRNNLNLECDANGFVKIKPIDAKKTF